MAENYDDENIAEPKPFPPKMVESLEEKTVGHTIREYVWSMEPIYYEQVSAQMNRELVSRFVGFEMPDLPPQNFRRVRIIADLYNLKENLGFVESLLNKKESNARELDRSIYATIILREIGDEAQRTRAAQYYEYLVSSSFAGENFDSLLECLAVFGNEIRPDSLRSRMEREIKSLAAREGGEPEAGIEKRYIEGLANNEFLIIEEGNKSRERISKISNKNQRLSELIKAYLHLTDDDGGEHFFLWTQQQIRRAAEAKGKETVIEAFRAIVGELEKLAPVDKNFCKVRVYNAIEFFDGKLTDDETEFMNRNRRKQIDPLRFLFVPLHIEEHEEEEELDEDEDGTEKENEA